MDAGREAREGGRVQGPLGPARLGPGETLQRSTCNFAQLRDQNSNLPLPCQCCNRAAIAVQSPTFSYPQVLLRRVRGVRVCRRHGLWTDRDRVFHPTRVAPPPLRDCRPLPARHPPPARPPIMDFGVDLASPPPDLPNAVAKLTKLPGTSFLVAPLAHPRYRRDHKRPRDEPMTRSDLVLNSNQWLPAASLGLAPSSTRCSVRRGWRTCTPSAPRSYTETSSQPTCC